MKKKRKKKTKKYKNNSEKNRHDELAFDALGAILSLIEAFCKKYLNEEYWELCEDMAWELYDLDLPLEKGKPAGWACGIVHALGMVNFLQDPTLSPHMTSARIAEGFGVSQQTMQAKSRIIRDELDLIQLDPGWCLPSLLKDNPLVWMFEFDGFVMDIRMAPREVQEKAYHNGLIPYIPADRQEPESESGTGIKIIEFPSGHKKSPAAESAQKPKDDGPTLFDE